MNARHDFECTECGWQGELSARAKTCPKCKKKALEIVWNKAPEIALSPHGVGWPDMNRRAGLDY